MAYTSTPGPYVGVDESVLL